VEIEVVKSCLENLLEHVNFGHGFISSGVTFCAMLPMRSIPFKVVCLVGMNMDAFPRESKILGFDLMAKNPRIGDRSRRNDDKYLFLEALISARNKLYISYVGQSIRDNTRISPSVLVSELIDYIKEGFGLSEDEIVTFHRLQAFSSEYFNTDSKLFSYSNENFAASFSRRFQSGPSGKIFTGSRTGDKQTVRIGPERISIHKKGRRTASTRECRRICIQ
jgi:exodeoxyribonuclease V gamma subunit